MKSCFTALFALFLLMAPGASAVDPGHSNVQIAVTDGLGDPVPAKQITIPGNGIAKTVNQDEAFDILQGRYTVQVAVLGAEMAVEAFLVDQPQQILTVAMKVGAMENAPVYPSSIIGNVIPATAASRIRVIQLSGSYYVDVPVMAGGRYQVWNLVGGDYMLIAVGSKGCVGTKMARAVSLPQTTTDIVISSSTGGACKEENK
jgi:hypothetical protein